MSGRLLGATARFVVWLNNKLSLDMPPGCPNCGFATVMKNEDVDTCPFCEWGPNQEPTKTAKEARREFVNEVFSR